MTDTNFTCEDCGESTDIDDRIIVDNLSLCDTCAHSRIEEIAEEEGISIDMAYEIYAK